MERKAGWLDTSLLHTLREQRTRWGLPHAVIRSVAWRGEQRLTVVFLWWWCWGYKAVLAGGGGHLRP